MSTLNTTTSTSRPTLGTGDAGASYFETDSKNIIVWDGTDWRGYQNDGISVSGWSGQNRFTASFDGTNDYMETGVPIVTGTEAITLSGWVYLTATPASYDTFISIRGSTSTGTGRFLGLYSTTRKLTFGAYGPGVTGTTVLSLNTWYHIAATCSGAGAAKVYLDGVLEASGNITYNSVASGNTFTVARGGGTEYAQAKIDDVAVWNEVLGDGGVSVGSTATGDIASLYNSGAPGNIMSLGSSGPKGWWRMGDGYEGGSGTTIYDMSFSSNHGTLTNGASIASVGSGEDIYV
jgi:hypothetical protein